LRKGTEVKAQLIGFPKTKWHLGFAAPARTAEIAKISLESADYR
jgi:hypothetical protein